MASFKKYERLSGIRQVSLLFDRTGKTFRHFPLLFILRPMPFEDGSKLKVLISVPNNKFGRAVDRNLLKRRIRAIHQQYKDSLVELLTDNSVALGIVYIGKEIMDFQTIELAYQKFINELG